jgi:hypothetical protein
MMTSFVVVTSDRSITVESERVAIEAPFAAIVPVDHRRIKRYAERVDLALASGPSEAIVPAGARVAVSGRVIIEREAPRDVDVGYREELTRVRLVATATRPITIEVLS